MAEKTLAERYQIAMVLRERLSREASRLNFENEGVEDRKYKKEFEDQMDESVEREQEYAEANDVDLLAEGLVKEREALNKRIERKEKELTGETDPRRKARLQASLEKDRELKEMDPAQFSQVMVEGVESEVKKAESLIKSETLIGELGLQGNKNYLVDKIAGIYDQEIIGALDENEISQLAEVIRESKDFKNLLKFSKVESMLDAIKDNNLLSGTKMGQWAEAKSENLGAGVDLRSFVEKIRETSMEADTAPEMDGLGSMEDDGAEM